MSGEEPQDDENPYKGTELETKFEALRGMVCAALDEYKSYTEELSVFDTLSLSQKFLPGRRDGVLINYMIAAVSFISASMGKVEENAFETKRTEIKAEIKKGDDESAAIVREMLAEDAEGKDHEVPSLPPEAKGSQADNPQIPLSGTQEPQDQHSHSHPEEKETQVEFKELQLTDIERLKKRLKDAGHHCLAAIVYSKFFAGDPAVKEAMSHMAFLSAYFFGAWALPEFFRKRMTGEEATLKVFTLPLGLAVAS